MMMVEVSGTRDILRQLRLACTSEDPEDVALYVYKYMYGILRLSFIIVSRII